MVKGNNNPQHPFPNYLRQFYGKKILEEQFIEHNLSPSELIKNAYIQQMPSMTKRMFSVMCNRCGNKKRSFIGEIDCKRCNATHYYCRRCIQMGRVLECTPLYYWVGPEMIYPKQNHPCIWKGQLTPSQQHASDVAVQAVEQKERLLIWGVCGAGKTEMIFAAITKALQRKQRICIATPRSDVVRELTPRFQNAFPHTIVQSLYAGSKENNDQAQLTISTTHQLIHFNETFDTIIIDEIDAFPYHADDMLPFVTSRSVKQNGTTIYLTATPRKEQHDEMNTKKLPYVFVSRRFHGHDLPVPTFHFSYVLDKYVRAGELPPLVEGWMRHRKDSTHQILLFVPTIELAEKITNYVKRVFVKKGWLKHENHVDYVHAEDICRKEKIDLFRANKLDILVTTTILERGVTFPAIDVIVFDAGNDVFDEAALVQIAGRAGRSADDPSGEVVFIHDGKTRAMVRAKNAIVTMNNM